MNMENATVVGITLIAYKLVLLLIGWLTRHQATTMEQYFVGRQNLGPVITALSYSASSSSAWTLLGMSGITFALGLSTIWLALGSIAGMLVMWFQIGPRLHRLTREKNLLTIPQLLSEGYAPKKQRRIAIAASVVILVSFAFYISAQFQGTGNILGEVFHLPVVTGIVIGAVIIYLYTYMGGYLAVSATDTLQGLLMACTALIVPLAALVDIGGPAALFQKLAAMDGAYASLTAGNIGLVALGLVCGSLAIGLSTLGQPHLLTRFITVKDEKSLRTARGVTLVWFIIVFLGMWLLGLVGHFLVAELDNNENIFFALAGQLFHPVIHGILMAALISAIMSTVDSQILVCASCVSLDLRTHIKGDPLRASRLATGLVTLCAVLIAVFLPEKIFSRVLFAWVALGSAFGPGILAKIMGWRIKPGHMLAAITAGFAGAVLLYYFSTSPGAWMGRILPFCLGLVILYRGRQ